MPVGAIGQEANNSTLQGLIKQGIVKGITTSTWNPRSGGTTKLIYKGTQEQVTAYAKEAQEDGYEYNITGGHIWTFELMVPWDLITNQVESQSNPLFIWELLNHPFEKDLLELNDRPFIGILSMKTKDKISEKLKKNEYSSVPWDPVDGVSQQKMASAFIAYNLKRMGIRGNQGMVQSLRRTIIIPNTFVQDGFLPQYDFKLFSKEELLNVYSLGSNPLNNIPDAIRKSMPDSVIRMDQNYRVSEVKDFYMDQNGIVTFVGWLQYPVECHMVSTNKIQISQYWTFNQFSAGNYGLYDLAFPLQHTEPNPITLFFA